MEVEVDGLSMRSMSNMSTSTDAADITAIHNPIFYGKPFAVGTNPGEPQQGKAQTLGHCDLARTPRQVMSKVEQQSEQRRRWGLGGCA